MKGQVKHIASCICSGCALHILSNIICLDLTIMSDDLTMPSSSFSLFYFALWVLFCIAALPQSTAEEPRLWKLICPRQATPNTHTHTHSLNTVLCQGQARDIPLQSFLCELAASAFFKGVVTVNICYLCLCNIYTPVKSDVYIGLLLCQLSICLICFIFGGMGVHSNINGECFWCLRRILVIDLDCFHHGQFWSLDVSFSMAAD